MMAYLTNTLFMVHLSQSILFNASLGHGFVPNDHCFGVILPLLTNKHGDASKLDMYRGITLSCLSKPPTLSGTGNE